jgi:carboxypeptidase family protein
MQRSFSVALGIAMFLASLGVLRAQEDGITVSGNVYDPSGAVVSGATLEIKIEKCKCSDCKSPTRCDCCPDQLKKESNAEGHYSFTVPHGEYRVFVQARELKGQAPLDLREGSALSYDFHLTPGVQVQ